jgi:hypothetical protein
MALRLEWRRCESQGLILRLFGKPKPPQAGGVIGTLLDNAIHLRVRSPSRQRFGLELEKLIVGSQPLLGLLKHVFLLDLFKSWRERILCASAGPIVSARSGSLIAGDLKSKKGRA